MRHMFMIKMSDKCTRKKRTVELRLTKVAKQLARIVSKQPLRNVHRLAILLLSGIERRADRHGTFEIISSESSFQY